MNRMISPFPDEKEKASCLRQLQSHGSCKSTGGFSPPPNGGLVFILSSGKDERQRQDPVNPVNPV